MATYEPPGTAMFPKVRLEATPWKIAPAKSVDIKPASSDVGRLNPSNTLPDYDTRAFSAGAGPR